MKINDLKAFCLILLLGFNLAGCSGLSRAPLPITRYTIDYPRESFENKKKLPVPIKIDRFGSSPGYASTKMIYADGELNRSSYTYHHWFAPPSQMIAAALYKDFKYAGLFSAVTLPLDPIDTPYVLSGSISDFYQKKEDGSWYAVLELSILGFTRKRIDLAQDIFLEKQYTAKIACNDRDARTFAKAMSSAVSILSRQIILDVYMTIAAKTDQR